MHTLTTEKELRAVIGGEAAELVAAKITDRLTPLTRRFIEESPFLCIATSDAAGNCDVSPRGDPRGFVRILDERRLLVPERPGNKLADTLLNLLENPHVGLLFLIPGVGDTFRVNGRATLTTDPELLAPCVVEKKTPKLGILVEIDAAYTQCPKAIIRSDLWNPAHHIERSVLPSCKRAGFWRHTSRYIDPMRWIGRGTGAKAPVLMMVALVLVGCAAQKEDPADDAAVEAADETALASDPSADLLTKDIDAWKQRFAERVAHWKQVEPRTESGNVSGIDYVYIPQTGASASNLLVMNSGIHGVEAPAGVTFEDVLLNECAGTLDRSKTAVLVIHVMNPFGARNGRRFNENNVDLNRNSFDAKTAAGASFPGLAITNPEYAAVRSVVENRLDFVQLLAADVKYGQTEMTKALSGQYEYPQGIYYGGNDVQPEVVAVESIIDQYAPQIPNLAFIDMHTGLSKAWLGVITTNSGVNQLMTNPLPPDADSALSAAYDRENAFLDQMFPNDECDGVCVVQHTDGGSGDTSTDFVTTGDITQWIQAHYADKRRSGLVLSVTAEIATDSPASVLETLANENYCYQNANASVCAHGQHDKDVAALRESFNPSRASWRKSVMTGARQMCKAVTRFAAH